MRYFAVIDTNVLVSALLSTRSGRESNPMKVVQHILAGDVRPVFNEDILSEYHDVLHRAKFHFDSQLIDLLLKEIRRIGVNIDGVEVDEYFPDPDDAVFFEVAMAQKGKEDDTYLVTGNTRHFPVNKIVVTPTEFITLLKTNGIVS